MSQSVHSAMILAAGRGERLRPLTDSTPKPLLRAGGKMLIEYHIARLQAAGITRLVINTAWLADKIHAALGDGANYGVSIRYSDEGEALETAGGIIRALPLLEEPFIVINGDVWCDFDFRQWQQSRWPDEAHLLLVDNPPHHPQGDFALHHNRLRDSGEPRYTYSGIGLFSKALFAGIPADRAPLAPLLRRKAREDCISAEHHAGRWYDIGTAERLDSLHRKLLQT